MSNESYLQSICAQLARIPRDVGLQVAARIFEEVVNHTRVDSGQAAVEWKFLPYKGAAFLETQQIMWGYADVDPVSPVGYKWAMYDNSEAVYRYQFEQLVDGLSMAPDDIDGIMIYNPITAGFAGFAPGNDYFYGQNAFGNVDMDSIVASALAKTYAEYNSNNQANTHVDA